MIKLQCENCNANLVHEHGHFFTCIGCGVMYNIPNAKVGDKDYEYIPEYDKWHSGCTYVSNSYIPSYGISYDEIFGGNERRSYIESRKKFLGLF